MKKIFLFIAILFVFSCEEKNSSLNSSENESSNSTTVSGNTENSSITKVKNEKYRIENIIKKGANYYLADMKKVTEGLDNIFLGGDIVDIDDFFVHINNMEKGLKKASDYFLATECEKTGNTNFDSKCTDLLRLANEDLQLKQQWLEQVKVIMTKNGISNKDADNFAKKTDSFRKKEDEFLEEFKEFKKEF